jgi:hypothetical protein
MAREIGMKELSRFINEEVAKVDQELEKVDAEEVDADEYADTLAHQVDYEKALKINPKVDGKKMTELKMQEARAIKLAKSLRNKRVALEEAARVKRENAKLRSIVKKLRSKK